MTALLTGVVPVVPTIFHDNEAVDLDGTARVVDYLIDAGVDGLCLLANYSEQFSLTDAERDTIARTLLEHVAGRLPVIITASDRTRAPFGPVSPRTRRGLIELAARHDPLIMRWAR